MPTSDRSQNRTRQDDAEPPERAAEALARARRHARAAIAEALAAVGALLDASSLALSGEAATSNPLLGPMARILEGLRAEFDKNATTGEAAALLRSIAEALDAEIARWEARAETDPDARGVARISRTSRTAVGVRDPARIRRGGERGDVEASRAQEGALDLRAAQTTARATRNYRGMIRDLRRTVPRRRSGLTWFAENQSRSSRRCDARSPR